LEEQGVLFINITGLAVGMASAILILLWIQNEVSYDGFHEKRTGSTRFEPGGIQAGTALLEYDPAGAGCGHAEDFPEVEHTCRVDWQRRLLFTVGDKRLMLKEVRWIPTFFQVFTSR